MIPCSNHPLRKALWRCPACSTTLCGDCVKAFAVLAGEGFASCRACGGRCERVSVLGDDPEGKQENAEEASLPFLKRLERMWSYPWRGEGWAMIAIGTGLICLLRILELFVLSLPWYLRFPPWVLIVFLSLYLGAYCVEIIAVSAAGETRAPDWPAMSSFWDDILRPNLLMWWTGAICYFPAIVWSVLRIGEGFDLIEPLLLLAGSVYYPMALIGVVLADSIVGLSPVMVVPAIIRTRKDYVVVWIAMSVLAIGVGYNGTLFGVLPYVGVPLGAVSMMYLLMFEAHMLGSLYHANRDRIGWYVSTDRPAGTEHAATDHDQAGGTGSADDSSGTEIVRPFNPIAEAAGGVDGDVADGETGGEVIDLTDVAQEVDPER